MNGNITAGVGGCAQLRTGNVMYAASGIWTFRDSASTNDNYMLAFRAPNGQKVGWLDFYDATVSGFGQGVVSEQGSLASSSDLDGTYVYKNTAGSTRSVSISSNLTSQQITTSNGNTLSLNFPWTGVAR